MASDYTRPHTSGPEDWRYVLVGDAAPTRNAIEESREKVHCCQRPHDCVRNPAEMCDKAREIQIHHGPFPNPLTRNAIEESRKLANAARLPTDSAARKDAPIFSGLLDYFPDAVADVARLSKISNDKHNPGEPLHWSREKSNDHADCLARHLIDYDTVDDDTVLHASKVAWRALALSQVTIEKLRASGVKYP